MDDFGAFCRSKSNGGKWRIRRRMEMSIPVLRRRSNCGAGEKISNAGKGVLKESSVQNADILSGRFLFYRIMTLDMPLLFYGAG